MNDVYCLRMPGQLLQQIDDHEKANFSRPSKVWDRLIGVLPTTGEVGLLYVMASNLDANISIIYTHDGVEQCKALPILEKGTLGQILFLHCMTTLPVWQALAGQYDFEYIYFYAQKLAATVEAGNNLTYPNYVKRITQEMVLNADEDYDFNMFRFMMVGESRDPEHTVSMRACVRYVARSVSRDTSNNINEVFPIIQYGPYITFNSFVPHTSQIMGPYDNECILPAVEKYDLSASAAVQVISDKRITLHVFNGIQNPEIPAMTTM